MKNVLELRKSLDMTQAKFAELAGVTLNTVQKWERGINNPESPKSQRRAVSQLMWEAIQARAIKFVQSTKERSIS